MKGTEQHGGGAADAIVAAAGDHTAAAQRDAIEALGDSLGQYETARALADITPRDAALRALAQHKFGKVKQALAALDRAVGPEMRR